MTVYDTEDWFAFVRAVRATPDDDAPRVCVADWLDDRGEADRAELIRVQCELARRAYHCPDGCYYPGSRLAGYRWCQTCTRLNDRESCLLPDSRGCVPDARALFTRGFVESVTMTAADWLIHGDAIFARHPVAAVTLTTRFAVETSAGGRCHMRGRPGVPVTRLALPSFPTHDNMRLALLAHYWPGVRFTLPAPPRIEPLPRPDGEADFAAAVAEMERRFTESLLQSSPPRE